MGRVIYDSKRIIPGPQVTWRRDYNRQDDGTIIGTTYQFTVNGELVAFAGSPDSSGTFWTLGGYPPNESIVADSRLKAILRKQDALRDLFKDEGKTFEIQSADGSLPLTCNPRNIVIEFAQGIWYDRCPYTITFEVDKVYPEEDDNTYLYYLESASQSWSMETSDSPEGEGLPRTYTLTHQVQAKGKRFYDETGTLLREAWEEARNWVQSQLGFDSQVALSSGANNLPSYYQGFNHARGETTDEAGGTYYVTETWLLASGAALEDFEVSTENNLQNPYTTVRVQGQVTGLEVRGSGLDLVTSKYDNAQNKFLVASGLALARAQTYSGLTLNISPLGSSVGRNPITGTISYSFEYDTRPSNIIANTRSEVITVVENLQGDVFAAIPVLGRQAGPVLQDIQTKTAKSRQLSINLLVPPVSYSGTQASIQNAFFSSKPDISTIRDAINPSGQGFSQVYSDPPEETWEPRMGSYSYSQRWTYEA